MTVSPPTVDLILLAVVWGTYFGLHSLLASLPVKHALARWWPAAMSAYRLAFNTLAVALLLPPAWLTYRLHGPMLWEWTGIGFWFANGLALLAIGGFLWSLRYYDGSEFLGLRQWRARERSVMDQERFHLSPLHRFVRHPWYFLGLVLVWTRDMDAARLTAAVLISAYFVIGSRLEERKLLIYHGEIYRRYRRLVPALLPLPWRFLSAAAAGDLFEGGNEVRR